MVSIENFVKSMPPSLSELKVTPSFCFPFKIPDDLTATSSQDHFRAKIIFEKGNAICKENFTGSRYFYYNFFKLPFGKVMSYDVNIL